MKKISLIASFDSSRLRLKGLEKKIVSEAHKNHLGRHPTNKDIVRFKVRPNDGNFSITDHYFDDRKIGSLATIYILDMPRKIVLEFMPCL